MILQLLSDFTSKNEKNKIDAEADDAMSSISGIRAPLQPEEGSHATARSARGEITHDIDNTSPPLMSIASPLVVSF